MKWGEQRNRILEVVADDDMGKFMRLTYGASGDDVYFVASDIVPGHSVCVGVFGCGSLVVDSLLGQHEDSHGTRTTTERGKILE